MSKPEDILQQLEPLRAVPARSDLAARSGLQAFLNEAAQLRAVPHAVSAPAQPRLTGWKSLFQPARSPMVLLAKIMLIVTLMVGGAGATTVAAQSSLPGDGLYSIKLLVEDARVALTAEPQAQIELRLELAQTRTQEMQQLSAQHRAIPDNASVQLQTQLQAALDIAAHFDDTALQTAMQQIETRVMTQAQALAQVHSAAADQILLQTRTMAQLGQSDPAAFRARVGVGRPIEPPTPIGPAASHTPMPTHTVMPSHTPQATRTPLPSHTPQATRTPQGNQYGPGPQVTSVPQSTPAPQATPNQGATTQPVATPIGGGDGHEYGPQPTTQPGNGEPQATPSGNGEPQSTPSGNGGPQATPSGSGGNPEQTPQPGGGGGPH